MPTVSEPIRDDDDDEQRLAIVLAPRLRERLTALLNVPLLQRDLTLVESMARREATTLTADHRRWIDTLLWRYRRVLPAGLALKLNPDDPIVREMEDACV